MVNQVSEDVAELMAEMTAEAETIAQRQRDPSIPEGAVIGEGNVAGMPATWKKQSSMVRAGNTPLPERFPAYDRNNRLRMLPTAQMIHQLSKRHEDGTPVFTRRPREGVAMPEPIADSCEWCNRHRTEPKRFYSDEQLDTHKRAFHGDEYEARQRAEERAERRAQTEAMLAAVKASTRRPGRPRKEEDSE